MRISLLGRFRHIDWWLYGAVLILFVFSLATIFSIESAVASEEGRFWKQFLFVAIGIALLMIITQINYRFFINYAYVFYSIGLALLIGVLLFGVTIRGTTGWFQLEFLSLQPVEFAKIASILVLARFVGDYAFQLSRWHVIGRILLLMTLYAIPVLLQPDLGSTSVLVITTFVLLVSSAMPLQKLLIVCAACVILAVASWFIILQDYQKDRFLTFFNPSYDILGSGYNVTQAMISVGSGKFFGRGLGLGPQSQLEFLPERESDFIFAVIAEELGFVGVVVIIGLYTLMILRLWKGLQRVQNDYAKSIILGFTSILFTQLFINIGMNIGIMPVTGIPLPFVSAGGSSLLAMCLGLGIVQNCIAQH